MKILIAEDESMSRRLLESSLVKWGYEVVVTPDGGQAWDELQAADAPQLAILDWMMPEMDGREICQRVRANPATASIYIILLTAKGEKGDIVAGLAAGANDHVTKPFDREELQARVEVGVRMIALQQKLADQVEELNQALIERQRADESRRVSESRYRHLVEHSQGLICTHDLAGTLLSVNPASASLLEYQPNEMVGRKLSEFIEPSYHHLFNLYLERIKRLATDNGLLRVVTKSGTERIWKYDNLRYEEAGQEPYVLGHAQDVTEIKRAEAEVRDLSIRDALTGLYNRRGFLALTEQQQKMARRMKKAFSLIYADMDGLKQINDTYGHQEGSEAIQQLAQILRKSFRDSDIIARLGGDEFTILAVDTTSCNITIPLARLQENLLRYNTQKLHTYQLSLSVGAVCVNPDDDSSIEDLLVKADHVMYENKKRKKQTSLENNAQRGDHLAQFRQSPEP